MEMMMEVSFDKIFIFQTIVSYSKLAGVLYDKGVTLAGDVWSE